MPSFDVVSEINIQEARNAVENAERELDTRFDFRGVQATFEWVDKTAKMTAEAEFQLQQMLDILRNKLVKRGIDMQTLEVGDTTPSGKTVSQTVSFKEGLDTTLAKAVVKFIKDSKAKVQASIQGEQVRVSGKKRDDLQACMALLKQEDFGQPLQFNNFRD